MKILNFGSLNIDYVYEVPHFVQAGETLSSASLKMFSGGKGLNQSVALGKSGACVYHAGAVGREDGEFLLKQLEEAGVDTAFVRRTEGRTGHAIIQRDPSGQNCILLFGGANQEIRREDVDQVLPRFAPGDYLVLQNEISETAYIMEEAHKRGMRIVLNPSPMDAKIHQLPLAYVSMFLLNEIEAAQICGHEGSGEELLAQLSARFSKAAVVLTLGEKGALYGEGEEHFVQPACPVKAVDTTAAGDTFTGYLLGSLARGCGPREAMAYAAKASAIAVSRPGAAPSIPEAWEVYGA